MKENAIKALLCIGTFILFVVLHTFYRMAGGNSSLVGAWIGNLLFLLPGISVPFYIWKKYPFNNNNTDEVSHVLQSSPKDTDANNPNPLLQSTKENNSGPTFSEYKSINDRFAQANGFENNNTNNKTSSSNVKPIDSVIKNSSSEKSNPSPSEELNQKLEQLKQLHKSGLLTDKELEEKSAKIKLDFRTTQAQKKIQAIKQIKKDQVQSAVASGVLSEAEAHIKIKQIEDSVVCPYCENVGDKSVEFCAKCFSNKAGTLPDDVDRFYCECCGFQNKEDFETCALCLANASISENEQEEANNLTWMRDYNPIDIILIICALVGIGVGLLMMR